METTAALAGDSDAVLGYQEFTQGLFFIPFMLRYAAHSHSNLTTLRCFKDRTCRALGTAIRRWWET